MTEETSLMAIDFSRLLIPAQRIRLERTWMEIAH